MWVNLLLSICALNHSCLSWLQGNVVNLKQAEKLLQFCGFVIVRSCLLSDTVRTRTIFTSHDK